MPEYEHCDSYIFTYIHIMQNTLYYNNKTYVQNDIISCKLQSVQQVGLNQFNYVLQLLNIFLKIVRIC